MTIKVLPIEPRQKRNRRTISPDRFTPIKLDTSQDIESVSGRLSGYANRPLRKLIYRANKVLEEFARGGSSELLKIFSNNLDDISELLLRTIDSYKSETLAETPFVLDIEELSEKFFEEYKRSDLYKAGEYLGESYNDLPFEEKETLRQLVYIAVDYHNEQNGLNIRLVNKGLQEIESNRAAAKKLFQVLQLFASGGPIPPDIDIEDGGQICAELRRLKAEELELASNVCGIGSKRYCVHEEVDRYGRRNGEGDIERYGLYDDELPIGVVPDLSSDKEVKYFCLEGFDPAQFHYKDKVTWTYSSVIKRYLPVYKGVMKAKDSTESFLDLVRDLSDKLQGKIVFQIGPSHGGITYGLAQKAGKIAAVDILPEAIENTAYTLMLLPEEDRKKVTLILDDLSYLEEHVSRTGEKADFLVFNCPIFKGHGNPNSLAGDHFDLIKRTLQMLPKVLNENGEAYFLVGYPRSEQGKERLWTIDKLRDFLKENMPDWQYKKLDYEAPYNKHGTYGIVRISKK